MKKPLLCLLAALLCTGFASANLLMNSGFEDATAWERPTGSGIYYDIPDHWIDRWHNDIAVFEQTDTEAHSGSHSLMTTPQAIVQGGSIYTFQNVPFDSLSAGQEITVGGWVKVSSDFNTNGWNKFRIVPVPGTFLEIVSFKYEHQWPTEWTYYEKTFTVPAGLTSLRLDCAYDNVTSGAIYFDDMIVTPEPMTLVLLGLGSLGMLRRRR